MCCDVGYYQTAKVAFNHPWQPPVLTPCAIMVSWQQPHTQLKTHRRVLYAAERSTEWTTKASELISEAE